ncbi:MAG: Crp/Fnr family transcriptional regulator [Leptothrix sp. (in: b-proteobacteria)]
MASPAPVIALHTSNASTPYNPQAQACVQCSVRQFALFGALDEAALKEIHYHIADMRLEPGELIYSAQSPGSAVYTVRSGVVRMERISEAGERRILRLSGRTDLLGLESILHQTYAADAVACTTVEVCRIPRVLIDELGQKHPLLLRDLMKRWQRALDDADEWLTELTRGVARQRMLRLLLKLSEYGSDDGLIWLPTRPEMGAMLDMTFETASRLISALRRDGILEPVDQRQARIHMDALMAALRETQASR